MLNNLLKFEAKLLTFMKIDFSQDFLMAHQTHTRVFEFSEKYETINSYD